MFKCDKCGHLTKSGEKEYDLDVALFNFKKFFPENPETIVEKRIEHLMVPETEYEIKTPFSDSEPNTLFVCGSYEYNEYIYIIYGGGDTYIMAARVRKEELLSALEESELKNPFIK